QSVMTAVSSRAGQVAGGQLGEGAPVGQAGEMVVRGQYEGPTLFILEPGNEAEILFIGCNQRAKQLSMLAYAACNEKSTCCNDDGEDSQSGQRLGSCFEMGRQNVLNISADDEKKGETLCTVEARQIATTVMKEVRRQ